MVLAGVYFFALSTRTQAELTPDHTRILKIAGLTGVPNPDLAHIAPGQWIKIRWRVKPDEIPGLLNAAGVDHFFEADLSIRESIVAELKESDPSGEALVAELKSPSRPGESPEFFPPTTSVLHCSRTSEEGARHISVLIGEDYSDPTTDLLVFISKGL